MPNPAKWSKNLKSLLVAGAIVAALSPARAAADQPEDLHVVGLAGGTDLPIMVGGEIELAFTRYFVPMFGVGFLPGGFVDMATAFVGDASTRDLIRGTIQSSLALRFGVRSFPIKNWGLYASFSYMLYTLGGGVDVGDLLDEAGFTLPSGVRLPVDEVNAETTLHLLSFGVGYRWFLVSRLSLSVEASYVMAVGSSTGTDVPIALVNDEVDRFLGDIYRTYVKAPMLSLKLGFHLF